MKITDVRVHCLSIPAIPLEPAPINAGQPTRHTLIEIETESGLTGLGEAFRLAPGAVRALILDEFRPILLGRQAGAITVLTRDMRRAALRVGNKGLASIAISGVEIALWDILGKSCGKPVCDLLGGSCEVELRPYASMPRYSRPDEAAEAACRFVALGYRGVKLHQNEINFARTVRKAVGANVAIMFDAGGAWERREALDAAKALADSDIAWLEEPLAVVDDYEGLAWLSERSPVPVAGGENEYLAAGFVTPITRKAFDILQPDVMKCGGLAETRGILAMANASNLSIALHAFCHGPGLSATAQLSLATPGVEWLEINPVQLQVPYFEITGQSCHWPMLTSRQPGLGIELLSETVFRYSSA